MATHRQPLNRLTWLMIGLSLRRHAGRQRSCRWFGWGGAGVGGVEWGCGGARTQGRTRSRPAAALPSHPTPPRPGCPAHPGGSGRGGQLELPGGGRGAPAALPWRTEPPHLLDARDGCDGVAHPERREHSEPGDGDVFVELQQQQHKEGDHEEELQDVGEHDDDVGQPKQANAARGGALLRGCAHVERCGAFAKRLNASFITGGGSADASRNLS